MAIRAVGERSLMSRSSVALVLNLLSARPSQSSTSQYPLPGRGYLAQVRAMQLLEHAIEAQVKVREMAICHTICVSAALRYSELVLTSPT
eukprot:4407407-Pleurochrysis_carterae.AAC.6